MPFEMTLTGIPSSGTISAPITVTLQVLLGDAAAIPIFETSGFPWQLVIWWDFPPDWPGIGMPGIFPDPADPTLGPHSSHLLGAADWADVGGGLLVAEVTHFYTLPGPVGAIFNPTIWVTFRPIPGLDDDSLVTNFVFFLTKGLGEVPPLRLKQRDDGLGLVGHARLGLVNQGSSEQSSSPRVINVNRYT